MTTMRDQVVLPALLLALAVAGALGGCASVGPAAPLPPVVQAPPEPPAPEAVPVPEIDLEDTRALAAPPPLDPPASGRSPESPFPGPLTDPLPGTGDLPLPEAPPMSVPPMMDLLAVPPPAGVPARDGPRGPAAPAPAVPAPPPAAPAPPRPAMAPPAPAAPSPPAPVLSARVGDEERMEEGVRSRLAEAVKVLDSMDPSSVAGDQKEIVASVRDFVVKAREALVARDLLRARALAEKASTLAEELRRGRPIR